MQDKDEKIIPSELIGEISLQELINILFNGKWIILSITSIVSIAGVIYSLQLPNIYESKALLTPTKPTNSISKSLQNYSALAGFAGINLAQTGSENNSAKAIKTIGSLGFFENSLMPQIFLPNLMAYKAWNSETNKSSYNNDIYDDSSNSWIRNVSYPLKKIPSSQESFEVFLNHLRIEEDQKNGFITLSIKHQSPHIAKKWAELIIIEINNFYRQKDKLESKRAVSYLNDQIAATSLSEIKQVFAQLLQQEIQKLTLIEANQAYVFDYIDPPAVMEKKSGPQRSRICIMFAFLGGMLSIIIVFINHSMTKKKSN